MRGEELKKWRQKNGWSQGQLARALGVINISVSRWERGERQIPSFLGLALAYLELRGDDLKPKMRTKRKNEKGGSENGGISGMPGLPQKAKHK
jgi:transcriptional regulator with XRE-family HTH domain